MPTVDLIGKVTIVQGEAADELNRIRAKLIALQNESKKSGKESAEAAKKSTSSWAFLPGKLGMAIRQFIQLWVVIRMVRTVFVALTAVFRAGLTIIITELKIVYGLFQRITKGTMALTAAIVGLMGYTMKLTGDMEQLKVIMQATFGAEAGRMWTEWAEKMTLSTRFILPDLITGMIQLGGILKNINIRATAEDWKALIDLATARGVEFTRIAMAAGRFIIGRPQPMAVAAGITTSTIAHEPGAVYREKATGERTLLYTPEAMKQNWKVLMNFIRREYGGTAERIRGTWQQVLSNMADLWETFIRTLGDTTFFKPIRDAFNLLQQYGEEYYGKPMKKLAEALAPAFQPFVTLIQALALTIKSISGEELLNIFKRIAQAVGPIMTKVVGAIWRAFQFIYNWVKSADFQALARSWVSALRPVFDLILEVFRQIPSMVRFLLAATNTIAMMFSKSGNWEEVFVNIANAFRDVLPIAINIARALVGGAYYIVALLSPIISLIARKNIMGLVNRLYDKQVQLFDRMDAFAKNLPKFQVGTPIGETLLQALPAVQAMGPIERRPGAEAKEFLHTPWGALSRALPTGKGYTKPIIPKLPPGGVITLGTKLPQEAAPITININGQRMTPEEIGQAVTNALRKYEQSNKRQQEVGATNPLGLTPQYYGVR